MNISQPKCIAIALLLTFTVGCGQKDKPVTNSSPAVEVATKTSQVKIDQGGVKVHTDGGEAGTDVSVSAAGISIETDSGSSVKIGENVTIGENVKISSGGVEVTGGDMEVEISEASGSAGKIVITGMSEDRKIDGEGKDIVISGASNDVTITGNCSSLVVSGASNDVILESSKKIVVTGTTNDVTYTSGNPKIVNTGVNNSVEKE